MSTYDTSSIECKIDQAIFEAEKEFVADSVYIDAEKAFEELENKYFEQTR